MKQMWSKRFPALVLCVVILITLCGCQKKAESLDNLPLDSESAAYMESLYGLSKEDAIKEFGLSETDVTEVWAGLVCINEPITILEKEFTKGLDIDLTSELFCGMVYTCNCNSAEEVAELAEALYLAVVEEYGVPKHKYLSGPSFLCNEGIFDEIRTSSSGGWDDSWVVGEISWLSMSVTVREENEIFRVGLQYEVLPEEWPRFDPDFKPLYPLGPSIRGDDPVVSVD